MPFALVNYALVEQADLKASNGVFHIVDRILVPPSLQGSSWLGFFCHNHVLISCVAPNQCKVEDVCKQGCVEHTFREGECAAGSGVAQTRATHPLAHACDYFKNGVLSGETVTPSGLSEVFVFG